MSDVLILLGSKSDLSVAEKATSIFENFEVKYELSVASAHRTPARVEKIVKETKAKVIIAIAGLSAALPGAVAAQTEKPVIGVPVSGKVNLDSILSIVQMPPGIPVAAVGLDRGDNAAILAVEILSLSDKILAKKLSDYRKSMAKKVVKDSEEIEKKE